MTTLDLRKDGYYVVTPETESFDNILFVAKYECPLLEDLQDMVGGYVEKVNLVWHDGHAHMLMDEEAPYKRNPQQNPMASAILQSFFPAGDMGRTRMLLGTIVILCGKARLV
jgi:hypothetical protein